MLLSKSIIGNSRIGAAQWDEVTRARMMVNKQEDMFRRNGFQTNASLIPKDVYQDFDRVGVEAMRPENSGIILSDLLPSSKSVSIGKLVSKFRRVSEAGAMQTSMTGQVGIKMDQVEYSYDGSLVPVQDTGFYRNWRENAAMTSEDFDALVDDNRAHTYAMVKGLTQSFLNGHANNDGVLIQVDGIKWEGMKGDDRVAAIDIGTSGVNFDFTSTTATGPELKAALIEIRDTMWITNKCGDRLTYYISFEIASNWERAFYTHPNSRTIMEELSGVMGVAGFKVTPDLVGNEFMGYPLGGGKVRPVVGMGVNTVGLPRPLYNSNYEFAIWSAIGFEVKTDFYGNTCAFFAQELT